MENDKKVEMKYELLLNQDSFFFHSFFSFFLEKLFFLLFFSHTEMNKREERSVKPSSLLPLMTLFV